MRKQDAVECVSKIASDCIRKGEFFDSEEEAQSGWKVSAGFFQVKGGFVLNATMRLWVALRLIVKIREMGLMGLIVT